MESKNVAVHQHPQANSPMPIAFDSKAYQDFPWLTTYFRLKIEDHLMDAREAIQNMQDIRDVHNLSIQETKDFIRLKVDQSLRRMLAFTGMNVEYRAVCHDDQWHNLLSGTPIGETLSTEIFQSMGVVFSAHAFEFFAWAQAMGSMFNLSHNVRKLLMHRWVGQTSYLWMDADHAMITLYMPESAVEEFRAATIALEQQASSERPLDFMDWKSLQAALADRFMVKPIDVTVSFLHEENLTETGFSATITIDGIPDAIAAEKARLKSQLGRLDKFVQENDSHDEEDAPYRLKHSSVSDSLLTQMKKFVGMRDIPGLYHYDCLRLSFACGNLKVMTLGNVVLEDGGVPLAYTAEDIADNVDAQFRMSADCTYNMSRNVLPASLSDTVNLARMSPDGDVYGPLADALLTIFRNLFLPKALIGVEQFLCDARASIHPPQQVLPDALRKHLEIEERLAQDFARWRRECRTWA